MSEAARVSADGGDMGVYTRTQLVGLLLVLCTAAVSAQSVQYVYDDLGRLIAVIDTNGDTGTYTYDAVGNILSIDRHASSQVSIISFTPALGPVGTTVTVFGTGFSATANQNTVTFNGTAATVSSASSTQLVVTVPASAATGTIGVTAPAGSASSALAFTLGSLAPTVAGFTPGSAITGTNVTVTGTNFDPSAAIDRVVFNASFGTVSSASATSLTAGVPPLTGSGRVTVITPFGSGTSATDLIIPPSPYGTADVASSGRLPVATDTTYTVSTANKIALALFDGVADQRMSVYGFNGMSGQQAGCDVVASIYSPTATKLTGDSCMESTGFIDVLTLPTTGTYSVLIDPVNTTTGSLTLDLYEVPADFTSAITPGGSTVTVTTTTPGQNASLTFSGASGQRISVLGTAASGFNQSFGCDLNVTLLKPDGTTLGGTTCMDVGGFIDATTLPADGTYTVRLDPPGATHGSITMRVYDVPADLTGTIAAGGSSVRLAPATPGQNGTLTFSGTSGQRISLRGTNVSGFNQTFSCDLTVTIKKPDATNLASACMDVGGFIDTTTLPTTGTYTILVDPLAQQTGSVTLSLYAVSDIGGSITADGTPVTFMTTTPGQNGSYTFSGTSGTRISLSGSNASGFNQTFSCDLNVRILKPDTTTLVGPVCMDAGGFIEPVSLPATGTYTITLDPGGPETGSLTLALYTVPADFTGTVTIGGSAVAVTISTPGQNGSLTFSGTASQQVTVHVTNNPWTVSGPTVKLISTNGTTVLAQLTSFGSSFNLSTVTLPATGTYTITVDPSGAQTGSLNVSVSSP